MLCIHNIVYIYMYILLYTCYIRATDGRYFEWFEISTFRKRAKEAWDNDDNIGGPLLHPPLAQTHTHPNCHPPACTTTIQSWCLHTRATGGDAALPQFRRPLPPFVSNIFVLRVQVRRRRSAIQPLSAAQSGGRPNNMATHVRQVHRRIVF